MDGRMNERLNEVRPLAGLFISSELKLVLGGSSEGSCGHERSQRSRIVKPSPAHQREDMVQSWFPKGPGCQCIPITIR